MRRRFLAHENGATLIEVTIILSILSTLIVGALVSYQSATQREALSRSANALVLDLRHAQNLAISAALFPNPLAGGRNEVPLGGYGVFFPASGNAYVIFADWNGNKIYDGPCTPGGGECLELRQLAQRAVFDNGDSLTAIFCPPYGITLLYVGSASRGATPCAASGGSPQARIGVTVRPSQGSASSKTVAIYASGAVGIE
jgi:Flp pilus assembly pilin Flp